jgi:hypothetical protein
VTNSLDTENLARLLTEIRDGQRVQLERQAEALAIQKQQFEIVKIQFEQAKKLQDRAQILHDKSKHLVEGSRRFLFFVLPVVIALIIVVFVLLRYAVSIR